MSVKKAAVISLKWPIFVPGIGVSRYLQYTATRTVGVETECSVSHVRLGTKWVATPEQLIWIREDCVISRQYVDQVPKQGDLFN